MPADKSNELDVESETLPSEKETRLSDGDISPQNQDALLQIASMIRLAESFRLGFVKCNQPIQCHQLVSNLKKMLAAEADVITVNLKEPVSSLRRAVLQAIESGPSIPQRKKAIMVLGFERSIPSEEHAPALDELNQSRDNFPKSFSGPFLIWLPDYALTRLAREAPDFWGWRSGVFEFSSEQKIMSFIEKTMLQGWEEDRLSLAEKRELASALEGLIRDYQELGHGEREVRALVKVILKLGRICYLLGDYDKARKLFKKSQDIAQKMGDMSSVARSLNNLGVLAQFRGNYEEARMLYQQSMEIFQDMGDKRSMLSPLQNIGMLAQDTGNYEEARKLYQQSLKTAQEMGYNSHVAVSLHNLGMLAQLSGDYEEARILTRHGLEIFQEIGDKLSMSASLQNLGEMAQNTGNYEEARKLYQQSLKIAKELGDKGGISESMYQLGVLAQETGNYEEASKFYQQSLDIAQELGDKSTLSKLLHNLGDLAQNTGDNRGARKLYQQSLEIKHHMGDKSGVALTLTQFSLLEEKERHLDKALEMIKQAELLFQELKSPITTIAHEIRERLERKLAQS